MFNLFKKKEPQVKKSDLDIILYPNKILLKPTEPVVVAPDEKLIEEMRLLMIRKRGVGLSANQAGINQSFFIANFSGRFTVCINPKIINHGKDELTFNEGCLSILDETGKFIYKPKKRWAIIDVVYQREDLQFVRETLKRWDAKIFQHEMDHLEGKLCQQ